MTAFNIVTLLCVTLFFGFSIQDKLHVHINNQIVQKLRPEAAICGKEIGVPATTLRRLVDWPLNSDVPTKKFLQCVCFNGEYADKDGHMIIESMNDLTAKNGTQEEYLNKLRECNKITLENNFETLFAIGICVHEKIIFTIDS